jgi:hypothetical protein
VSNQVLVFNPVKGQLEYLSIAPEAPDDIAHTVLGELRVDAGAEVQIEAGAELLVAGAISSCYLKVNGVITYEV